MARIRTLKPEFWTDSAVMGCSRDARLLFIGILNFADDEGNFAADLMELKVRILPSNDVDIGSLIKELVEAKMIQPYEIEERHYFNIRNFKKHQVINRPSPAQHPPSPWNTKRNLAHGGLSEHSQRKEGKERKERKRRLLKKLRTNRAGETGTLVSVISGRP